MQVLVSTQDQNVGDKARRRYHQKKVANVDEEVCEAWRILTIRRGDAGFEGWTSPPSLTNLNSAAFYTLRNLGLTPNRLQVYPLFTGSDKKKKENSLDDMADLGQYEYLSTYRFPYRKRRFWLPLLPRHQNSIGEEDTKPNHVRHSTSPSTGRTV